MTNTTSKSSVWLKCALVMVSVLLFIYAGWISAFVFPATLTFMQRLFVGGVVLVVSALGLLFGMRGLLAKRDMHWPYAIPLGILMAGTVMLVASIDKVM